MPIDILLVTAAAALVEVAGIMLLGRGVLWMFGPRARKGNHIYDLLTIGTMPFIRLARKITPRFVPDAQVPAIAFLLLVCIWIGLGIAKQAMLGDGSAVPASAPSADGRNYLTNQVIKA